MATYANKHTNSKKSDTKSVLSQQSKNSDQHKIDLVNKMQQNEEKHKQLMLDNLRRRKEKERQLKSQEEQKLKEQSEALQNRKKTKEQAYVNYLRHNSKNILAEFKQEKYINAPKAQSNPIKQGPQNNNFEALDLEISQLSKNKNLYKDFKQPEFEVLRQSELLDSLDLSQCKSKRPITKEIQKDPPILAQLAEQNSESEEDDLWNQTFKNGKMNQVKKPIQPEITWTEQIVNQADDVLSKMSAKHRSKSPISREVHKEVPKEQKYKETKSTSQNKEIRQQQPKEIISQQKPKVIKTPITTHIEAVQVKRPPVNVKITQRKPQVQSQNSNDDRAHIQEFLSEDLINLNSAEVQLQKELQQLNKENKVKGTYEQSEDQIEASLIRLDQRLVDLCHRKQNDTAIPAENAINSYNQGAPQGSQHQKNDKRQQQNKSVSTPEQQQPNNNQRHTSQQQQISKPPLIQQQQQATTPEQYSSHTNQRVNQQQQQQSYKPTSISQQQYIHPDPQQQLDYQQFLIEQQNVLKQQLYDAQMKLYDQEQQQQIQQKALSQQAQSQQQNRLDLPKFPEYTIHPDHQSLISQQTQYTQKETNLRPRNVITHDAQNTSIVSSQQSDKYNFDIDFGGIKTQNTYQKQAEKRTHQKHSQVRTPIKELPEEGEGKIEVRQDLKQLLFD